MSDSNDYNNGSLGIYTTGSTANQLGLAQHRHRQQEFSEAESAIRRPKDRHPSHLDHWIRIVLSVGVSGSVGYVGLQNLVLPWYLPVGVAALLAIIIYRLLCGPLKLLVNGFKWALAVCAIGVAAYALVRFVEALHSVSN
jgi:hypothetical protein